MRKILFFAGVILISVTVLGQQFEEAKPDGSNFENLKVRVGADFAMQFQGLNHNSDSVKLIPLGSGINLPTANLVVEADLARGIKVNLETYLSSRHHVEAWVKGGYLLLDELPFLNSEFIDKVMKVTTLKIGVMELDFGDAHFRRSDNGQVIKNPFVGNYIMDAFTTAPALEILVRHNGILLMGGINSGSLKPALSAYNASSGTYTGYNMNDELALHWKAGYDKQITDNLRLRGTVSGFHCFNHHFGSLYNGDRTGSRYYLVMKPQTNDASDVDPASGHTTGRWGPGFTDKNNALMANLFGKFKGFELFGTFEYTTGTLAFGGAEFTYQQLAVEGLYRFGKEEQFYGGARYNLVSNQDDESINRIQAGAGWFLTKNIMAKVEYVNQNYKDFRLYKSAEAGFSGIMVEAAISF
jgi:hypothetical protein